MEAAVPSNSYSCYVDGGQPLKVTLCWTDPQGTAMTELDNRMPALVNDLDLKVIGPDGIHYPFRLRFDAPEEPARSWGKNWSITWSRF